MGNGSVDLLKNVFVELSAILWFKETSDSPGETIDPYLFKELSIDLLLAGVCVLVVASSKEREHLGNSDDL